MTGPVLGRSYQSCVPDPVEIFYLVPSKFNLVGIYTPFAAAEDEWIKGNQQDECLSVASFRPAGFHLFV